MPGQTVRICEDDPFKPDECLANGITDGQGRYHIPWVAKAGIVETDLDIYAEYKGDGIYDSDKTGRYTMSVHPPGGSITLDPIPSQAALGDVVALSGMLRLDAHSPEGSIVYIKDEDSFNPDDLLVSAYVNASGHFSTYWIVEDVDPNPIIEIQAVYEGGSFYNRMATPIQNLMVYEDTKMPEPEPDIVGGDGYMELYRSLDFDQSPHVAIVASPDSYDQVSKHIIPVQEGISLLTAMLEQEYRSGDWNVSFEVIKTGENFSKKPDVIVDLVTRDDNSECWDRYTGNGALGWAYYTEPKPVPTTVCSLDGQTNEEIGATAAHEFVHAIGLGHTFNIPGDLMCSVEDSYGKTCPGGTGPKSTTFSALNLAALAAIYGTDGFQNPNNHIERGTKFDLNGITAPTVDPTSQYNDVHWPNDCNSHVNVDECLEYYCTTYWDTDDFISYDVCLADPFAYTDGNPYPNVLWPDACYSYEDVDGCLEYYCTTYWDYDGFTSYDVCLADPFSYHNPYENVERPDACYSYEDVDACLNYYCAVWWDDDGFISYDTCLADPFAYTDGNPYPNVLWPDACYSYEDVDGCLEYYCASYWDYDGFTSYDVCLADPFSYYNPYTNVLWPDACYSYDVDSTVYPVPFGEPKGFSVLDMLYEELMQTEDRNRDITAYTALRDLVDGRANYIDEPAASGSDFRNAVADEGLTDVLRSIDDDWTHEIGVSAQWRELGNELDDMIDALEDMNVRSIGDIQRDITEVEDDLHYMSEQGTSHVDSCLNYYCASYWDTDGFISYDTCLADPFSYYNPYEDVEWPDECHSYEDVDTCLNYYCAVWWDDDGFLSYDTCLADPFVYVDDNLYEDVFWPDECYSYIDVDECLEYYCSSYWDDDGFLSYNMCLADPFVYLDDNPYEDVEWPDECYSYIDVDSCLIYYCETWWDYDGFASYYSCLDVLVP